MTSNKAIRYTAILQSKYPAVILRVIVGCIFVFSAVTKLPIHTDFVSIVQSYQLLPDSLAAVYGNALPWVELVIGSFLVLGIQIRASSFVTILICLSFLAANISSIVSGESFCGNCFGEAFALPVSLALTLDIAITFIAVYLYVVGKQPYSFDSLFAR
jgi:putative oxidoreductase